jgi:hypothetical protein
MRTTPYRHSLLALLLFLASCFVSCPAFSAGAGAPEIAPSALTQTLYVNVATGNDTWSGASATFTSGNTGPVKTIKKAWALAVAATQSNKGVRILVAPGTYLEGSASDATALSLSYPANGKPIVLEGTGWSPGTLTGDVIITGAAAHTGWSANGDGTWSAPWPYNFGLMDLGQLGATAEQNVPEVFRRLERLWVNGTAYLQFTGPSDPNLPLLTASEGAFWVNTSTQTITARPPSGQSLAGASVEAAVRRRLVHWYRPSGDAGLPAPIVLRNLVFRRTGEYLAFFQNSNQLTIEDCAFRDARHISLYIGSTATQSTVRRVEVSGAGGTGFGHDGRDHLVEDFTLTNNGRQALVSKFLGWAYGGMKIGHGADVTYRRWTVTGNFGVGVWFDTACHGVELLDSTITGGNTAAIFIENNNSTTIPGLGTSPTLTIRGNVITNHIGTPGVTNGKGIQMAESENVLIENNVIANNEWALSFPGGSRGPQRNIVVKNNLIASATASQPLYFVAYGTEGWNQAGRAFDTFSVTTNDNLYLSPSATAFLDRTQTAVSFSAWKTAHSTNGQNFTADRNVDSRSTFTSAAYAGQALVRIEPGATYLPETGATVDGFRITRLGGSTSQPLTLALTTGGTAQAGRDFIALPTSVTLQANETSLIIPFTSVLNGLGTGSQTVSLTIGSGSGYLLGQAAAQFILEDLQTPTLPRVSLSALVATASEQGPLSATVRFTRTGNTAASLTVPFTLGGAAAARFQNPGSSLTIPIGATSADLSLVPIDDSLAQITQSAVVSISSNSSFNADTPSSATVSLLDNDIISPGTVTSSLAPGSSSSTTSVTLANPTAAPQTFTITVPPGDNFTWADSNQSAGPAYQWTELNGGTNGSSQLSEFNDKDNRISLYTTGQIGGPSGGIPIGFSFPFYGTSYADLRVSSNGVLYFGGLMSGAPQNNSQLPTDNINNFENRDAGKAIAALAFFWDDLRFRNTGYAIPSTAWVARPDSQTFIIQFQDVRHYSDDTKKITCQVVLKATGEIIIAYKEIGIPFSLGATIGAQGPGLATAAKYLQISHNSDYVQSGMAIRLRPGVPWLSASTSSLIVPANSTGSFNLTTNATGLSLGDYSGFVTVASDLSAQPELTLPVTLSITDNTPPANPSGLAAVAVSTSAINLTWTDASSNETGFTLERSTSPTAGFALVATLAANSTTYSDTGLAADTTYYYRIKATNSFGSSNYSAKASALTFGGLPATLRLRWTFDEASGNALATNSAGSFTAGNGVFSTNTVGVPTRSTSDRPGNTGASLDLSGNSASNDHVRAADTSGSLNSLEDFTSMTMTFWVKLTAPTLAGNERILSKCPGSGGYELILSGTPSAARLNLNLNNQSSSSLSSGTVNLTGWTFVAVTWTGGSGVTYYAGTPTTSPTVFGSLAALSNGNPTSFTANTGAFQLGGRDGVSGDRTAAGHYDDVRIYASALTATELEIVRQQNISVAPAAPSALAATPNSSSQITVTWTDNSSNETGFKLERSSDGATGWTQVATPAANATSHADTGLTAATTYHYRLRATNAIGDSSFSAAASATTLDVAPAAPSALAATTNSSSQITVTWIDNSTNETGFKLERSPDGATGWTQVATPAANATSHADTGLTSATTYHYRLRATNAIGDSPFSAATSATTLDVAPAAPSALAATTNSSSQITLTWTDNSSNETGFILERSLTPSSGFTTVATPASNSTSYTNIGLSPGTRYYYRLRSANDAGQSTPSAEADATTRTAYEQWKIDTGLGAGALGNADLDGDGVSNLLEYALAGDPASAASAPSPTLSIDSVGGTFLMLTFTRAKADATYQVEGSNDLVTWATLATNPGALGAQATYTDTVDLSTASPARRFLRLRVTIP